MFPWLTENNTFWMWFWIIGISIFSILAVISERSHNKRLEKRNREVV